MSKIHSMMDIGKRSMMNSQTALQTSGHNISNKSTEGFSRQRVEIQTNVPIGSGKTRYGMGSKTAAVTRVNNSFLERQIGNERSLSGFYDGKAEAMARVEQVYNEQQNKGLNQFVADFFSSVQEMANNPESLATRTQVRETADFLTKDFKRVHSQLTDITRDLDQQIGSQLEEVNSMAKEVANLNEKIQQVELSGGYANDERDRRELLVKQIGDRINIRWAEGKDSTVTITAGNSAVLVAGYDAKRLEAKGTPETDTKGEGNVDIFYINNERATPVEVTSQFVGGKVGGLLDVRDKVVTELLTDLDKMAYSFAANLNEVHRQGFDVYNRTNLDFFELPQNLRHASANMKVSNSILEDVGRIATGGQMASPGDNRVALKMARLQQDKVMGGESTLDEFYNSVVGKVGIQAKRAETSSDSQRDIVKQLGKIRESISGVSLDEEATKLIEYQKSFDASARLIRTADEMFDTVLNLKRM
ncbi:MAG: flagellar hook-associated protein FlgK [Deltaproteobacteria bacterium]|jgi:flagellar hook-associated protein 1 FlgK|nr:flagellar hook-associated protein FlgK [Deltaproteobacteria bacterium]